MLRLIIDEIIWEILNPLLPAAKGRHGKNDRMFIEALYWIIRTGAPWRDLPTEFGPWKTVYNRYSRWVKKGYLDTILEAFKKI